MPRRETRRTRSIEPFGPPDHDLSLSSDPRIARRERMLCREILETLSLSPVLARDPLLRDGWVARVEPAPDASRLRVEFCIDPETDPRAVDETLGRVAPALRAEVAASIHRKRTPLLCFHVVTAPDPRWSGREEVDE